jgi:molybdopterin-guanine dinucleotide biosynthesis protein A
MAMADTAILLLAGGRAERFPGKLEHAIDGQPMIVRVYHNLRAAPWPIYIARTGLFAAPLAVQLDAPLVIDRRPECGPLAALRSACELLRSERIFAVAADQPHLRLAVLEALARAWEPGDEAVVPQHDGRIEPLAALYARWAVLHAASFASSERSGAMHELIDRIAARFLPMNPEYFLNVNTPADLPRQGAPI